MAAINRTIPVGVVWRHLLNGQNGGIPLTFKDIVERDKARAKLYRDGLLVPHGPNANTPEAKAKTHELRNSEDANAQVQHILKQHITAREHHHKRHHHGHHTTETSGATSSDAASPSTGGNVQVTDAAVTYTAQVGVGQPATEYTLLIDTGSSNTWVGAGKKYVKTSTSKSTGNAVSVSYGSGSFSGTEFNDTVTLSSNLVITNQGIGDASKSTGFSDVDGILGVGPVDLTSETVKGTSTVPTVTDNLFSEGTIRTNSLGISFNPSTSAGVVNGELTFGGTDSTKFTGNLNVVPITSTSPASEFWGIDQTVTYGTRGTSILNSTAGIVDTGTTLLLLATDAFQKYQSATGATMDQQTGLLSLPASQFSKLQDLNFRIGSQTFTLTPDAQVWPVALNSTLGGSPDKIYLVTSDLGSNSGQGLDFIDGFAFLQRFYSVFDTGNAEVGLATTEFTNQVINNPQN